MSLELICPDCHGIIGATRVTEAGRPCTCFQDKSGSVATTEQPNLLEMTDPDVLSASDTNALGEEAPPQKICWKCGADVAGKKRLRDAHGYWCYDCHKEDQKRLRAEGVRCADCGRIVPETAIIDYEGLRICGKCRKDRLDALKELKEKKKFKAVVDDKAYVEQDRRQLYVMLAILAVLFLIIVFRHFLPSFF